MPHKDPAKRKGSVNYGSAKARAARFNALVELTPEEDQVVRDLYLQAAKLTLAGEPHEVDHKVPLSRGGKHHPRNLQLLPKVENIRKRDRVGRTQSTAPVPKFRIGMKVLAQQVNGAWEPREISAFEWVFEQQTWLYETNVPIGRDGQQLWAKECRFWESELKALSKSKARKGFS